MVTRTVHAGETTNATGIVRRRMRHDSDPNAMALPKADLIGGLGVILGLVIQ
jgi:hypothetical protein